MQKLKRIGLAHAKNKKKTFAFPVQEIKKNFAHAKKTRLKLQFSLKLTRKTDMATRQT